jgi:hypothetical protein
VCKSRQSVRLEWQYISADQRRPNELYLQVRNESLDWDRRGPEVTKGGSEPSPKIMFYRTRISFASIALHMVAVSL